MKEKIFSALKSAVSVNGKTSISDKTLNAYVEVIAGQITDESSIGEAIKPHVTILKEIQANINAVAATAVTTKEAEIKSAQERKAAEEAAKKAAEEAAKNQPDWQKAIGELTKTVESLAGTVTKFSAEKTQQELSRKLSSTLKEKGVPEWHYNPIVSGRTFKEEADVEAFAESVISGWSTAKQELANQGFKDSVPPAGGGADKNDPNDAARIAREIEDGTKKIVEQKK